MTEYHLTSSINTTSRMDERHRLFSRPRLMFVMAITYVQNEEEYMRSTMKVCNIILKYLFNHTYDINND